MSTVLSAPHDATVAPSGENLMELTASPCPSSSMMGASSEDVRFMPGFGWGCCEGTPTIDTARSSTVLGFCATTCSARFSGSSSASTPSSPAARVLRFPAPPPPQNSNQVKNFPLRIEKAGSTSVFIPYRSAPIIQGKVWADTDGDAQLNIEEVGFSKAKLFLDEDGNFELDENETSFAPDSNGSFLLPLPPGQYSLCIAPDNADANITFPIEEKKAYLTWVDYESPSDSLLFGVQDNQQQDSQSSENNQTQQPQPGDQDNDQNTQESESSENAPPEEVNALYERLLQEMESKSKNLDDEKQRAVGTIPKGRDY